MKKIISIIMLLTFISCSYVDKNTGFDPVGIYECKSKVDTTAHIFKFDSGSDSTNVWLGTDMRVDFYDINSKEFVTLREDNLNYECKCIEKR